MPRHERRALRPHDGFPAADGARLRRIFPPVSAAISCGSVLPNYHYFALDQDPKSGVDIKIDRSRSSPSFRGTTSPGRGFYEITAWLFRVGAIRRWSVHRRRPPRRWNHAVIKGRPSHGTYPVRAISELDGHRPSCCRAAPTNCQFIRSSRVANYWNLPLASGIQSAG